LTATPSGFLLLVSAERALDAMNFSSIRGRTCRIMWSHRDPSLRKSGAGNIFVKNLDASIDSKALYDTFSIFGNILSCKVAASSKTRESLGYGFVQYETEESAQTAVERVNGMVIAGHKVSVAPFKSKKERGGDDKTNYTNLYVKNVPEDLTKEAFEDLFKKFGTVNSSMLAMEGDKNKGFGFVNFETTEAAKAAVEGLNNLEISGKKLYVGRAQKKDEREKELKERFEQLKAEKQKKHAGVNLYVKNLADTITTERLLQEFAKYGEIKSATVMLDQNQKSRGFGFVCFSTPEEATKAVTETNGKMLEGKPLYVALAQRKDVRRSQLEAQYAAKRQNVPMGAPMYPAQGAPMYYTPQGVPQRMMYPQAAMMPRRAWNPQGQPQGQGPQQGRPGPQQQQMMYMAPMQGARPNMGGAQGGGRGRGQRGGQPPNGVPKQPGQQQPGGGRGRGQNGAPMPGQQPQGYKYAQQGRAPGATDSPSAAAGAGAPVKPLVLAELTSAPEEQQKQMIGERLFPLIQSSHPKHAGKITGMLLEMDNYELIHLLESSEALSEKVEEALQVLTQSAGADGDN